jgi:hypothetical protein
MFFQSLAVGVSQYPESFTSVRGTHIVCSEHTPSCIEPCFGQRSEDFAEVSRIKQTWDVLQQRVSGSNIANTFDRLRPLVPFVFFAPAFSRNAKWLAGKACRNHIDIALVFFRCTGLDEVVNVAKDWGFVEEAVFDPLREDLLTVFVPFDVPD